MNIRSGIEFQGTIGVIGNATKLYFFEWPNLGDARATGTCSGITPCPSDIQKHWSNASALTRSGYNRVHTYADEIHAFRDGEKSNDKFQKDFFRKIQELDHDASSGGDQMVDHS